MNDGRFGLIILCTAFAAALFASCGYQFAGAGPFPYGVKKIAVEVFANRTSEPGLENTITNDLIYELNRSGQVKVTDPENADAVIRGTIEALAARSVSRSGLLTSEAERVTIRVDVRMVRPGGEVLWQVRSLEEDEAYAVAADKLSTEENRRQALKSLSPRLAQKIYNRMTANF